MSPPLSPLSPDTARNPDNPRGSVLTLVWHKRSLLGFCHPVLHNGDNHSFFGESGQGLCGYCLRFQMSSGKEGNGRGTVGGK